MNLHILKAHPIPTSFNNANVTTYSNQKETKEDFEMAKQNCWEFKKCGREHGGANTNSLGVCPASTFIAADGYCEGKNGGRGCVYITGTFCGGNIQGTFRDKEKNCSVCEFYKILRNEHRAEISVLNFKKFVDGKE